MDSPPLITGLETATLAGSIAVCRGDKVLATHNGDPGTSHSNTLLSDLDQVLRQAGIELESVDVFAVTSGPGSFTGLRIGIATVKALSATLQRPCVGVPTLEAIAHSAGESELTVVLLPAGRGEVFVQSFSVSSSNSVMALDAPSHLSPRTAIERYAHEKNICWAGEGTRVHSDLIKGFAEALGVDLIHEAEAKDKSFAAEWKVAPSPLNLARHVALLAVTRLGQNEAQTPDRLHAIYVRPSDAELKV
jgi:tRNA threonylcarbamoyladenosine biosynthesis protein TsaB